jgi:hypothetical protein
MSLKKNDLEGHPLLSAFFTDSLNLLIFELRTMPKTKEETRPRILKKINAAKPVSLRITKPPSD